MLLVQEWTSALSVIQPEEIKRVGQFVYQRDAKFALVRVIHSTPDTSLFFIAPLKVGRLLIWAGLCQHMGGVGKLRGCSLTRNERGKPLLLDVVGNEDKSVSFNISHQVRCYILFTGILYVYITLREIMWC